MSRWPRSPADPCESRWTRTARRGSRSDTSCPPRWPDQLQRIPARSGRSGPPRRDPLETNRTERSRVPGRAGRGPGGGEGQGGRGCAGPSGEPLLELAREEMSYALSERDRCSVLAKSKIVTTKEAGAGRDAVPGGGAGLPGGAVRPGESPSSSGTWPRRRRSASSRPMRCCRTTVVADPFADHGPGVCCSRRLPRSCRPAHNCSSWAIRSTWRWKWICSPATPSRSSREPRPSWSGGAATGRCRPRCA